MSQAIAVARVSAAVYTSSRSNSACVLDYRSLGCPDRFVMIHVSTACTMFVGIVSCRAIGDIYNYHLDPSLTLGCGSWGSTSVSANVGPQHLINIKTGARGRVDGWRFDGDCWYCGSAPSGLSMFSCLVAELASAPGGGSCTSASLTLCPPWCPAHCSCHAPGEHAVVQGSSQDLL